MGMLLRLLAAADTALADFFDPFPCLLGHERFVATRMPYTVELHLPEVVAVPQDRVDVSGRHRSRRTLWSGERRHTAFFQLVSNLRHRPFARRVDFENPAGVLSALWIEHNRAHLPAVLGSCPYIEIAERDHAWRATIFGLLEHSFVGLGGEVTAVELRDRRHDAVHQHAAPGLGDVLRDGDQLGARFLDGDVDLDVVDTVSSQAVDLVHDDEVTRSITEEPQHPLKLWSIR